MINWLYYIRGVFPIGNGFDVLWQQSIPTVDVAVKSEVDDWCVPFYITYNLNSMSQGSSSRKT